MRKGRFGITGVAFAALFVLHGPRRRGRTRWSGVVALKGARSGCPIAKARFAAMNLSVRDTAALLRVSEKTIYRWIKQQAVPAYRVQDQYRFNRAEILEWATSRRLSVSSDIFVEPEAAAQPVPSLLAALEAGGVFYRVAGADRESALREMVELLRLPEEVDRGFLLRVLLAREAIASTAIGEGIAVPHVRNPVVLHVGRPFLALGFLDQQIEYGALDGKPVHTLFIIISPTTRAHLHLMSKLSFVLRDPGVRRALRRQEPRPAILKQVGRAEQRLVSYDGNPPPSGGLGAGERLEQSRAVRGRSRGDSSDG